VIAVDSSVVIAVCASWHESHQVALRAFEGHPRLIGHSALDAYSVLTRLPGAQRVPTGLVVEFLRRRFPHETLVLSAGEVHGLVADLHQRGIAGGAVSDGIVAMSARAHGAELVSLDRRAAETYRRCDVAYRLL
jgi:predicted nucleic acid-binding protein